MEDVDEVYGCHNWPTSTVGNLHCIPGVVMAEVVIIEILIHGKGGHGSRPDICIDPISVAVDFHIKHRELNKKYEKE